MIDDLDHKPVLCFFKMKKTKPKYMSACLQLQVRYRWQDYFHF